MIVMLSIIGVLLLIANVYLLAYYTHPDDNGKGIDLLSKIVVVIGMTLTWTTVLMFPLDVSNARSSLDVAFRMDIFWQVVYLTTAAFILIIIPSLIFYYEADPDWTCFQKIKYAFCYLFLTIIIVLAALLISYAFLSKAYIPINRYNCSIVGAEKSSSLLNIQTYNKSKYCSPAEETELEINVSFPIYLIGFMSFISWFLFCVFGGIGIAAIPLDFFYDFCTRPKKRTLDQMVDAKQKIIMNAQKLKELAGDIKDSENKGINTKFFFSSEKRVFNDRMTKLRAATYILNKEYRMYKIQTELNDKTIFYYYIGLLIGIISALISLAWLIHILLYFVILKDEKPIYPFLNNFLTALVESGVGFIATIFIFIFSLYLLWATIKGSIKFGVRLFCFWNIHPMIKNETYMNSFLFNIMIILLTSVSVTQFLAYSFRDYGTMTDLDLIFSVQIRYLMFFNWFYRYHVFEYILFAFIILSFIYLICRRRDVNSLEYLYKKYEKEEHEKLKA